MKITELNGNETKKLCGCVRAIKRYHNRHTDGSGNFGFTIVYPAHIGSQSGDRMRYSLDGDYNNAGEIISLCMATFSRNSWQDIDPKDIAELAGFIREFHESFQKQEGI